MTDDLAQAVERFVRAHRDELTADDLFTAGLFAGIVTRVHHDAAAAGTPAVDAEVAELAD